MRRALETSLEQGAIGMSTGLYYPPAKDAPTEEVIALAKPMRAYGGIHTTHMRDEASHLVESVNETIEIGKAADVPVVISHHKASGTPNHGLVADTLKLIDEARKIAGARPRRLSLRRRLDHARRAAHLRWRARSSSPGRRACPSTPGQTLDAIAQEARLRPWRRRSSKLLPAGAIYFMMSEDDVRRVLSYPHTMIGSDGLPHDEHPHPRLWGTFPRVLGHYVRDVKLFPLEEAVRRMTALPAAQFGLKDRGSAARRRLRRPGAVRSGDHRRHRDLRAAEDAGRRHRAASWSTAARSGATARRPATRPGRALRRNALGPMGGSMPAH